MLAPTGIKAGFGYVGLAARCIKSVKKMFTKLYDFSFYLPIRALMRAWLPPAIAL